MFELNNFDSIQISIASPEKIREWSHGEVTKPETINYRTQKPEKDGLFCEKIFGPTKDWECHCGKYKRVRYKGVVCDKCGVEVTRAKVRRERMGHIELATPVVNPLFFKEKDSKISVLLDIPRTNLKAVVYFENFIVTDPGETGLEPKQILTDREVSMFRTIYGDSFKVAMGGEAIVQLLKKVDIEKEWKELKETISKSSGQKKVKAVKRLEIVDAFHKSGAKPEWMVLTALPVLPPELRPMVQLDGGRFATSALNDLYRSVIARNNRIKKLMEIETYDVIIRNEKRMLQKCVDNLIDGDIESKNRVGCVSLFENICGIYGVLYKDLIEKGFNYSGCLRVVINNKLEVGTCLLPIMIARELFSYHIRREIRNYLIMEGISYGSKEEVKNLEKKLSFDEFNKYFNKIKDKKLLIVSSCSGGAAIELEPKLSENYVIEVNEKDLYRLGSNVGDLIKCFWIPNIDDSIVVGKDHSEFLNVLERILTCNTVKDKVEIINRLENINIDFINSDLFKFFLGR